MIENNDILDDNARAILKAVYDKLVPRENVDITATLKLNAVINEILDHENFGEDLYYPLVVTIAQYVPEDRKSKLTDVLQEEFLDEDLNLED